MTTYNSYEAAKIANPESEIVTTGKDWDGRSDLIGKFEAFVCEALGSHGLGNTSWVKCNPSDYCMTVEKFLADGHKFVEGDKVLTYRSNIFTMGESGVHCCNFNIKHENNSSTYILRAAALEEKKPRTKVEYVKWNFEFAWHAIKAFEDGEKLYTKRSHKDYILIDNAPDVLRFLYDLHECIETPMTEREEFVELMKNAAEEFTKDMDVSCINEMDIKYFEFLFDSGFRFVS